MKKMEHFPHKRLVFYDRHPNNLFWDAKWERLQINELLNATIFEMLQKYLPNMGKSLEAGCGLGQYVKMFRNIGYDIEGIDFSRLAIKKTKKSDKELSLTLGDVLSLPYKTRSFTGCFSLGVVEHFEKGPEDALREMHRVLIDGGILLLSVPFFNPLRQIKGRIGAYSKSNNGKLVFYQYAFTMNEFKQILEQCGFAPLSVLFYDVTTVLIDEIPHLRMIERCFEIKYRKNNQIKQQKLRENNHTSLTSVISKIFRSKVMCQFSAHMMVFVAKKVSH
jgi:SAM-dependent methyltransferase